jgi:hypothetical protein
MNARKSLLTKALLSAGAFAVLAGSAGTLATSAASAATHPAPLTAVTKITNRLDGGGGGSWAYDSFARNLALTYLGKVTPAMVAANPALAPYLGMYQYNATLNDSGTFKDMPGQLTPNQGKDHGRTLKPVQVSGPMAGYGQFGVFYASQRALSYHGVLYTVPPALKGTARNASPQYASSVWPELAFPNGTVFAGVTESGYSYTYKAVPVYKVTTVNGKKVTTLAGYKQQWVDSAWNGDGQLRGDGDILGLSR